MNYLIYYFKLRDRKEAGLLGDLRRLYTISTSHFRIKIIPNSTSNNSQSTGNEEIIIHDILSLTNFSCCIRINRINLVI